jgi:hypothetical protein
MSRMRPLTSCSGPLHIPKRPNCRHSLEFIPDRSPTPPANRAAGGIVSVSLATTSLFYDVLPKLQPGGDLSLFQTQRQIRLTAGIRPSAMNYGPLRQTNRFREGAGRSKEPSSLESLAGTHGRPSHFPVTILEPKLPIILD